MDRSVPVRVQDLLGAVEVVAGRYPTCTPLVTGQVSFGGANSAARRPHGHASDGLLLGRCLAGRLGPRWQGYWCAVSNSPVK